MYEECADKTVRSLENTCHTWSPYRCDHDKALYKYTFTLLYFTIGCKAIKAVTSMQQ